MAALVLALEVAGKWLWEPLRAEWNVDRLPTGWASVRGTGLYRNNHLFFGVLPLSFLLKHGYGGRADQALVLRWMDILKECSLGRLVHRRRE